MESQSDGSLAPPPQQLADPKAEPQFDSHLKTPKSAPEEIPENLRGGANSLLHSLLWERRRGRFQSEQDLKDLSDLLLTMGADDINARGRLGNSALHISVNEKFTPEAIKQLLQKGADRLTVDFDHRLPLHGACRNGNKELAELLLDAPETSKSAQIRARDCRNSTPLHEASHSGNSDLVDMLLSNDADPTVVDEANLSPLHLACESGNLHIVQYLLKKTATNVNQEDFKRRTPLHVAIENASIDNAEIVSRDDMDHATDKKPDQKHDEIVKLLLQKGAKINSRSQTGLTPLMAATKQHLDKIMEILLAHESNQTHPQQDTPDGAGFTPLIQASMDNFPAGVQLLVSHKAQCDARFSPDGSTALMHASSKGHLEVVWQLLQTTGKEYGVHFNTQDCGGFSALHHATFKGRTAVVKLLLAQGADCSLRDTNQRQALHLASYQGNLQIASLLLEQWKKDIDARDNDGFTPLHLACSRPLNLLPREIRSDSECAKPDASETTGQQVAVIGLLLSNDATLRAKSYRQQTALHLAADRGDPEIITELLARMPATDADQIMDKDDCHLTALDYALEGHQQDSAMRTFLSSDRLVTATFGLEHMEAQAFD